MTVTTSGPASYYDPVTEADRRIETLIRERLGARFPDHRIVGEEHGDSGEGTTYWIIDPIDGTRSFISGMPTWGILLGLVVDGKAVAGIMHQPFTGETWFADSVRRHPFSPRWTRDAAPRARRRDAAGRHPLQHAPGRCFAIPGCSHALRKLAGRCRLQRWGGDCYGFALVAQGSIDLMVDSMLMPYDIVPLIPIIEGAGGVVTASTAGRRCRAGR